MSKDPLLQPYQLKHLTLKNRIMITSHEPAYPEDGMPKDRYRAYHEVRAKAGVAHDHDGRVGCRVSAIRRPSSTTSLPTRTRWCPGSGS